MTTPKLKWLSRRETRGTIIAAPPGYRVLMFIVDKSGKLSWWTNAIVAFGERWEQSYQIDENYLEVQKKPWERGYWHPMTLDAECGWLDDGDIGEDQVACYLEPGWTEEEAKASDIAKDAVRDYCARHKLPIPSGYEKTASLDNPERT